MRRVDFCCGTALAALVIANSGIARPSEGDGSDREIRLTPEELSRLAQGGGAVGSSHVPGIQDWTLKGVPTQAGVYTIALLVPKHTTIHAHWHPDDRVATVVRGTWYIGYGEEFVGTKLKALPPGSFYTEPPKQGHFAQTGDEDALVFTSGFGPTGTTYYQSNLDPRGTR